MSTESMKRYAAEVRALMQGDTKLELLQQAAEAEAQSIKKRAGNYLPEKPSRVTVLGHAMVFRHGEWGKES